ncbi:hypothetical protein D3P04_22905 [Paracoccus onubensis]|uniref:Uncharacterized protein n=1 Tax=Paracoccus onubensis TaxID=1675788 RepID=A0A418SLP5_9RHOB|nr:hypothetical protein D3P04_22905 [Paracoccus onubensis]
MICKYFTNPSSDTAKTGRSAGHWDIPVMHAGRAWGSLRTDRLEHSAPTPQIEYGKDMQDRGIT